MTDEAGLDQNMAVLVRGAARQFAPDQYVAALLAPSKSRDDLIALAAFWGETRRIAHEVSDPMLAEIRLQWWRDALSAGAGASGHPVADAMRDVMNRHWELAGEVDRLLTARLAELDVLAFETQDGFEDYLQSCDGALLTMQVRLCGRDPETFADDFIANAARALGAVRVALDLPMFAAHGRLPLWPGAFGWETSVSSVKPSSDDGRRAIVALAALAGQARQPVLSRLRDWPREAFSAVLPLALQRPYFSALQAPGHDPFRNIAALTPLNRFVRLIWANMAKRL